MELACHDNTDAANKAPANRKMRVGVMGTRYPPRRPKAMTPELPPRL